MFLALVVLGPSERCLVSRDDDPLSAVWASGVIEDENWWLAVERLLSGATDDPEWAGPAVADVFEVGASMTAADAYDAVPFVVDEPHGLFPKLVTTGLIEPGFCLWGEATCRYLKRDYQHPRVVESEGLSKSLRRRLTNSRRPKVLVAGLSKRIECFVDQEGEYVGAVSTFSIFHPEDDITELESLCDELLSEESTRQFVSALGGNAMGGGNITMKKSFLAALPYRSHVRM